MKKIKDNKIIDLRKENEYEKTIKFGQISKKINSIFKSKKNED